jgi:hypothetical protein
MLKIERAFIYFPEKKSLRGFYMKRFWKQIGEKKKTHLAGIHFKTAKHSFLISFRDMIRSHFWAVAKYPPLYSG